MSDLSEITKGIFMKNAVKIKNGPNHLSTLCEKKQNEVELNRNKKFLKQMRF